MTELEKIKIKKEILEDLLECVNFFFHIYEWNYRCEKD